MLTYNKFRPPIRKDKPWLLVVLAIIWVLGTAFFHSPWEPFEPYVVAVVKGIIMNKSWFIPYISNEPYLEIQPFYFWFFAIFIKIFNITNIYLIANGIRIINTIIITAVVLLVAKIGTNISVYKNGRTCALLLISSIGFIDNAYQLTPHLIIILGFCLLILSLELYESLPGLSGWILFAGLLLISINFNCSFITIAIVTIILLPICNKSFANNKYYITNLIAILLFTIIFSLYCYSFYIINNDFFSLWKTKYTQIFISDSRNRFKYFIEMIKYLDWYTIPLCIPFIWTLYKRKHNILKDKVATICLLLILVIFFYSFFTKSSIENTLFLIFLPMTFLASLEIDSIKITIASLINWFSIFLFGTLGVFLWLVYFLININSDNYIIHEFYKYSQNYQYHFNIWQLIMAILITIIWIFMITRKHIYGREMISNFASGVTFFLFLFTALYLPWFDSVLTFKPIISNSKKFFNDDTKCITTNGYNTTQGALYYYYEDINLVPSFNDNIDFSICPYAILATEDKKIINLNKWNILYQQKRPIDTKVYYVLQMK